MVLFNGAKQIRIILGDYLLLETYSISKDLLVKPVFI